MSSSSPTNVNYNLNADQLLALITLYQNEWCHREERLWKQAFRYYYVTLVFSLLPYISSTLVQALNIKYISLFPLFGIILTLIFLYINISAAMKTGACFESYKKAIELFNCNSYKYVTVADKYHKPGKFFGKAVGISVLIIMALSLLIINVCSLSYQ